MTCSGSHGHVRTGVQVPLLPTHSCVSKGPSWHRPSLVCTGLCSAHRPAPLSPAGIPPAKTPWTKPQPPPRVPSRASEGAGCQAPCRSIPGVRPSGAQFRLSRRDPHQPGPPDSYPAGHCDPEREKERAAVRGTKRLLTPAERQLCAGHKYAQAQVVALTRLPAEHKRQAARPADDRPPCRGHMLEQGARKGTATAPPRKEGPPAEGAYELVLQGDEFALRTCVQEEGTAKTRVEDCLRNRPPGCEERALHSVQNIRPALRL